MKNTDKNMRLVTTANNYDYYIGVNSKEKPYYNLVPHGQPAPKGGYFSPEYICSIKQVPNLFNNF